MRSLIEPHFPLVTWGNYRGSIFIMAMILLFILGPLTILILQGCLGGNWNFMPLCSLGPSILIAFGVSLLYHRGVITHARETRESDITNSTTALELWSQLKPDEKISLPQVGATKYIQIIKLPDGSQTGKEILHCTQSSLTTLFQKT